METAKKLKNSIRRIQLMKNYFDLTGDVAVVTGASSGLGVQFAKALANQGAKIALIARREEKLQKVKEEIENEFKVEVEYFTADLTDYDKVSETIAAIKERFGRIDILVNNAGLGIVAPTLDYKVEDWKKMLDININSIFYMSKEVGKIMKEQKYGRIINLGSIHSEVVMKNSPRNAYAATKGAVKMLTKSLAVEWALDGITVNALAPAYFATEMTQAGIETEAFKNTAKAYCPMERAGREGELDTTLLYLASHYSTFTTGQIIAVDGGWTAI